MDEIIKQVADLEAREIRDETGREIIGAHWVKRDEVMEILLRAKQAQSALH